jgi:hypothetical protein
MAIKSRKELLATIKPHHWRHLRADTGEIPVESSNQQPRPRLLAVRAV